MSIFSKLTDNYVVLHILSYVSSVRLDVILDENFYQNLDKKDLFYILPFFDNFFININIRCRENVTLFDYIIQSHSVILFEKMIDNDPFMLDYLGNYSLEKIVSNYRIDIMCLLYNKYNYVFHSENTIDIVVEKKCLSILKWIIDNNVFDLDEDDISNITHQAVWNGNIEMLIYLEKNIFSNEDNNVLNIEKESLYGMITYAIVYNDQRMVEWLLEKKKLSVQRLDSSIIRFSNYYRLNNNLMIEYLQKKNIFQNNILTICI